MFSQDCGHQDVTVAAEPMAETQFQAGRKWLPDAGPIGVSGHGGWKWAEQVC